MRGVTAAATRSGSSVTVSSSGSTGTGSAPAADTASQVATNVCDGTITSSPAPTPSARSPNSSASNPLPTVTQWVAPQYAANSRSNSATSGPARYRPESSTRATAASVSARSSA